MDGFEESREKAMKFGSRLNRHHRLMTTITNTRRAIGSQNRGGMGDDKMRVAVFEPVDEDVFNFIATGYRGEERALFSRQSLFGCEVTVGQPVRESYGITLAADIDESDDGFNEDAEIKVMPILGNKKSGFNPRLGKEDFIDFTDQVILANATSAFRELVETSVDSNCANDIWEMITNLNDQF